MQPKILVVDDEADQRSVTRLLLSSSGWDVSEAASGEEALTAVEAVRPDLILLDHQMDGMDGRETLSALRERYHIHELPILMLSGQQDPGLIADALDSGANDYISKDVSPDILLARVERHVQDISFAKERQPTLGEYRIKKCLKKETASTTYLLQHPERDRVIFARLLKPGFLLDEEILRDVEGVNHDGVCKVLSWGAKPVVYVFSEFSPGQFLAEYAHGKLGIFPALELIGKLLETLKVLQAAGAVHGDIAPDSVLINEEGQPKLWELGVVRAIVPENEVTSSHLCLGNPAYQGPERLRGDKTLDIRSDLYSLGALFFYLLTGKAPFEDDRSDRKDAPRVSEHRPDNVQRFDDIVGKLLSHDPKDRFQTVEQLSQELAKFEVPQ